MSTADLCVEIIGPVGRLRLNRPAAMNAFTTDMLIAAEQALHELAANDDIRVLVVTGTGKAFCAGADLKAADAGKPVAPGERDFLDLAAEVFDRLRNFPKPTIAALNGVCLAGGTEIALCCDIIIAAETAKFGDGHSNFGVFPGGGGAAVLPRVIPLKLAMYLLFTGRMVSAERLFQCGLISELHPAEQLAEAAIALATEIAARSPIGLRRMKEVARQSNDKSESDALLHEQVLLRRHLRSADMDEGLAAFVEKRTPNFRGK